MNMDKKAGHNAPKATLPQAENEKGTVPGQQIGLYSKADNRDVKQMVRMLNSPEEQSQKDRG
ncbi:hypothetical protein HU824_07990 [Bacteroides sp. L10-4]|jgi:hypothetical protein|nr:hypothetical protein [Bacteroides sp. L10-4]TGY01062.1 hypothetical protein E5355_16095 [Bacteroides muris (ex Afrizal et al. 2022)]